VRIFDARLVALAAAVALFLSIGAFAHTASANGPRNQFTYPKVMGVNGSDSSSVEMNLSAEQRFQIQLERVPWIAATGEQSNAFWRYDITGRDYTGVSGQYCKNKSGGDVFVANGAPADDSLTC